MNLSLLTHALKTIRELDPFKFVFVLSSKAVALLAFHVLQTSASLEDDVRFAKTMQGLSGKHP